MSTFGNYFCPFIQYVVIFPLSITYTVSFLVCIIFLCVSSVIEWFTNITEKQNKHKFMTFDVKYFYQPITEDC